MLPEQWHKVSALLDELIDLSDIERAGVLNKLRVDDPPLCDEVESLLSQSASTRKLEAPPASLLKHIHSSAAQLHERKSSDSEVLPTQAGRYVIQGEIARGGMGAILRARDPDMQRTLAVKILLPGAKGAEIERFLREARITGGLQHPGIPPIHELGRLADGSPFFAMKLVQGQTLATLMAAGPAALQDARLGIFEQICRTLAYAHGQGVIHRDLKPSNIMVGAFGEVQVMDWGLAKDLNRAGESASRGKVSAAVADRTSAGQVSGTPAYMAPEQARGEADQLDERCDVFGLGGILCALLTGRPPFAGDAQAMILASAQGDVGQALASLNACGADAELSAIARKCLAPNKEERYRNAAAVAEAVTRFREEMQEKLRQAEMQRETAQLKVKEERRRRHLLLALAAVILCAVLGAGGAALSYVHRETQLAAQKKYVEKEITTALEQAQAHGDDMHDRLADPQRTARMLSNLKDWQKLLDDSSAALARANALAGGGALVNADVLARRDRLAQEQDADRKDFQLATELDDICTKEGSLTASELLTNSFIADSQRRYTKCFADLGLDLAAGDPAEIAGKIRGMRLRHVLVAALDRWALVTIATANAPLRKNLMAVARLADPDPWRDQIRDPDNWKQGKLLVLAYKADFSKSSPQFLSMTGRLLFHFENNVNPFMRQAIAHHPSDFWLQFNTGMMLFSQPRPPGTLPAYVPDAVACFKAALAIRPESKTSFFYVGAILHLARDYDGAITYYQRAIALEPADASSENNLGNVYLDKRQPKQAMVHFRKALDIDPKFVAALISHGKALLDVGEVDECIAYQNKAIALAPTNFNAYNNLGVAYQTKKDLDRAQANFEKVIELQPSFGNAHNNLGVVLQMQNDFDGALECYNKAAKLDPLSFSAHINIGMVLQAQGHLDEACKSYRKAHELGSNLPGWPAWVDDRIRELERSAAKKKG